jgi:hypothetical protein
LVCAEVYAPSSPATRDGETIRRPGCRPYGWLSVVAGGALGLEARARM